MRATIGSLSKKLERLYAENTRLRAALEAAPFVPSVSSAHPQSSMIQAHQNWHTGPRAEALKGEKP